jgi:hypothetical protein
MTVTGPMGIGPEIPMPVFSLPSGLIIFFIPIDLFVPTTEISVRSFPIITLLLGLTAYHRPCFVAFAFSVKLPALGN